MKIAYIKRSRCNAGGTEKVVFNKTNYLIDKGYDVTLITSEHKDKPDFFPFSNKLKRIDLEINYSDLANKSFFAKICLRIYKNLIHRRRLKSVLLKERFDIVVSMYGDEMYWITDINDGSKKLLETHFSRFYRVKFLKKKENLISRGIIKLRDNKDLKALKKFDRFIVLSNEDAPDWGIVPNIKTIYNGISIPANSAKLDSKIAVAVGRLTYQKGFDMLIDAWSIVHKTHPDWRLNIYGEGGDKHQLQAQISRLNLDDVVILTDPTPKIYDRMAESSIYLMTSRHEGFGLVLAEAMSCGVPAVSFACKCGPRDIINDGKDGFLVEQDDITTFADRVCKLIEDEDLRKEMGANARKRIEGHFSEEVVMKQWEELFEELINK
ncbi:MAG: glycosyltransferase family 4 protein [Rikenellaceae bacterium]